MIAPGHTPKAKPSNKIHPSTENPIGRRTVNKALRITPPIMKVLIRPVRSVSQPPSGIEPMDTQDIRLTSIPALAISIPLETRKAGVNPNRTMKPALVEHSTSLRLCYLSGVPRMLSEIQLNWRALMLLLPEILNRLAQLLYRQSGGQATLRARQ